MENSKRRKNVLAVGTLLRGGAYDYEVRAVLGQGTFGITYLATVRLQGALGALDGGVKVAIKEFFMRDINGRRGTTVVTASDEGTCADYRRKFRREAVNLSKLHHSNIVKVLELFEANNTVYYVMEYAEGGSLDVYIAKRGGLEVEEALACVRQIGRALAFMHARGMLHLDLKPGNVMRGKDGRMILIDFGLSKQYNEQGEPESSTNVGGGTPGYAPLEQAAYHEGREFPVTMDVYALGATLYKMLTGERPAEASVVLNYGLDTGRMRACGVGEHVIACVERAMAPMKAERYQSVREFVEELTGEALEEEEETQADERTDEETTMDGKPKEDDKKEPTWGPRDWQTGEGRERDPRPEDETRRKEEPTLWLFRPREDTGCVQVEYFPPMPARGGNARAYVVRITPEGVVYNATLRVKRPDVRFSDGQFRWFLQQLGDWELPVRPQEVPYNMEYSEEPAKLVMRFYDGTGKMYARLWVSGWRSGQFGNLVADAGELNERVQDVVPGLRDYLNGPNYKEPDYAELWKMDREQGETEGKGKRRWWDYVVQFGGYLGAYIMIGISGKQWMVHPKGDYLYSTGMVASMATVLTACLLFSHIRWLKKWRWLWLLVALPFSIPVQMLLDRSDIAPGIGAGITIVGLVIIACFASKLEGWLIKSRRWLWVLMLMLVLVLLSGLWLLLPFFELILGLVMLSLIPKINDWVLRFLAGSFAVTAFIMGLVMR